MKTVLPAVASSQVSDVSSIAPTQANALASAKSLDIAIGMLVWLAEDSLEQGQQLLSSTKMA